MFGILDQIPGPAQNVQIANSLSFAPKPIVLIAQTLLRKFKSESIATNQMIVFPTANCAPPPQPAPRVTPDTTFRLQSNVCLVALTVSPVQT